MDEKSGRLNLKVPRSLHTRLVAIAVREKVSLNYLVGCMLAAEVEDDYQRYQTVDKST